MLKRIEELVDVTAAGIPGVCQLEYESGESGVEFSNPALERFVELIIKECVACAYWIGKFNTEPALPAATAKAFSLHIKKHFGVEDEQEY